jgi:Domain of unknown function (DUF4159)
MVISLAVVTCLAVVVGNRQRDAGQHSRAFDPYRLKLSGIDAQEIQDAGRNLSGGHGGAIHSRRKRWHDHQPFNSDFGDSWEWADAPRYPERYSALGIRIGVNYVVYAMTH